MAEEGRMGQRGDFEEGHLHTIHRLESSSLILWLWGTHTESLSDSATYLWLGMAGYETLRMTFLKGQSNILQYSCLENPMDREAWWASLHAVTRVGDD